MAQGTWGKTSMEINTEDDALFEAQVRKFAKMPRAERLKRIEARLYRSGDAPQPPIQFNALPLIEKLQELQKLLTNPRLTLSRRDAVAAVRGDPKGFAELRERLQGIDVAYTVERRKLSDLLDSARSILVEAASRLAEAEANAEFLADLGF